MADFVTKIEKVKVEAEQWVPGKKIEGVREIGTLAFLDRLGEDVPVEPGDWIVKSPMTGEFYAVGDAIFHRIYEAA